MTIDQLSDITQTLAIHDQSIRTTIEDLIEVIKNFHSKKNKLHFILGEYSTASLFFRSIKSNLQCPCESTRSRKYLTRSIKNFNNKTD
jgi:hypothetical protein